MVRFERLDEPSDANDPIDDNDEAEYVDDDSRCIEDEFPIGA